MLEGERFGKLRKAQNPWQQHANGSYMQITTINPSVYSISISMELPDEAGACDNVIFESILWYLSWSSFLTLVMEMQIYLLRRK